MVPDQVAGDPAFEPVSAAALVHFREAAPEIEREAAPRSLEEEQLTAHGERARKRLRAGFGFTSQILDPAMEFGSVALLDEQSRWAMNRLPVDGVEPQHVVRNLEAYAAVVREALPSASAAEVVAYIDWLRDRLLQRLAGAADPRGGEPSM